MGQIIMLKNIIIEIDLKTYYKINIKYAMKETNSFE